MRHTYWSSSSSLPIIIMLSETVWKLWPAQDFGFRGDNYIRKKVSCLSCMGHAPSSFLPNIIKICLRLTKLWCAQDFGFRGGNYIMKKVRVVSLACGMPTGPPFNLYQILSYYLKQYESYGLHKIFTSGETTTYRSKWELSLLHVTVYWSSSSSLPNIIKLSQTL